MVCNQNVPDPNKYEQIPDVVRERPCRVSDSWEHIRERRERHRHSHTRTHVDTHTHTCMQTDTRHSRTHTRTHTRRHTHTQTHTRTHAHTHSKTNSHAHTRTHTDTHMPRAHTQTRTQIQTWQARTGLTLPACVSLGRGERVGGWTMRCKLDFTENLQCSRNTQPHLKGGPEPLEK